MCFLNVSLALWNYFIFLFSHLFLSYLWPYESSKIHKKYAFVYVSEFFFKSFWSNLQDSSKVNTAEVEIGNSDIGQEVWKTSKVCQGAVKVNNF